MGKVLSTHCAKLKMDASECGMMDFEPVLGMPTSILKYGSFDKDTKSMFVIIPGNPGVIEYYDCFMKRLCKKHDEKIPVWGISHAGHVQPPTGNKAFFKQLSYEVCTLAGQIKHKVAFIRENIPTHVNLMFIGHSIGCYIILKILDQLEHSVQRCFMLFPTIERMAVSPNGRVYTPALKYLRWLAPPIVAGVSYLPESTKSWLIQRHFWKFDVPECIPSATLSFIQPFSVSNSLFMAHQEMAAVDELETDLVQKHLHILSFYFGTTDRWCPLSYSHDLKEKFPDCDIKVCEKGYSHAFVIDASVEMADIVGDWSHPFLKQG